MSWTRCQAFYGRERLLEENIIWLSLPLIFLVSQLHLMRRSELSLAILVLEMLPLFSWKNCALSRGALEYFMDVASIVELGYFGCG